MREMKFRVPSGICWHVGIQCDDVSVICGFDDLLRMRNVSGGHRAEYNGVT
jgi:hypothetical protein